MTMGKVSLLFSIVRYCLIASEKNLNSLGALFRNDYSSGGELLFFISIVVRYSTLDIEYSYIHSQSSFLRIAVDSLRKKL